VCCECVLRVCLCVHVRVSGRPKTRQAPPQERQRQRVHTLQMLVPLLQMLVPMIVLRRAAAGAGASLSALKVRDTGRCRGGRGEHGSGHTFTHTPLLGAPRVPGRNAIVVRAFAGGLPQRLPGGARPRPASAASEMSKTREDMLFRLPGRICSGCGAGRATPPCRGAAACAGRSARLRQTWPRCPAGPGAH